MLEGDLDIRILPHEVILEPTTDLRVIEGVPSTIDTQGINNPLGTESILIPNEPHVFMVDELTIRDQTHLSELLKEVKVLIAHGLNINGKWQFLNGKGIGDILEAYDRYAAAKKIPKVEVLVVCNEDPNKKSDNIRIGELGIHFDHTVAYSIGDNVYVNRMGTSRVENGKTFLDIAVDTTFFGLDDLIESKQIESNIKIQ